MSLELVVARYRESLAWLRKIPPGVAITVYDKSGESGLEVVGSATTVALPNLGFEAHSYLHHICERYATLSDQTVFCQGHPFDHASDLHHVVRELVARSEPGVEFRWLGFIIDTDDVRGRRLFVPWSKNHDRHELEIDRFHRALFGLPAPTELRFFPGGQFVASARVIRSRPIEFYRSALALSLEFPDAGHCFERLWDRVFGRVGVDALLLDGQATRYLKPIRRLLDAEKQEPTPRTAG